MAVFFSQDYYDSLVSISKFLDTVSSTKKLRLKKSIKTKISYIKRFSNIHQSFSQHVKYFYALDYVVSYKIHNGNVYILKIQHGSLVINKDDTNATNLIFNKLK
jgi:hypothetical protein